MRPNLTLQIAAGVFLGMVGYLGFSNLYNYALKTWTKQAPITAVTLNLERQQTEQAQTTPQDAYAACRHGMPGDDKTLSVEKWLALDTRCAEKEHQDRYGY